MKLISSVVRPDRIDVVKAGLGLINVVALTAAEALDYSPQRYETSVWMGHEYRMTSARKVEMRVVVHDDDVDEVVGVIMRLARTGQLGDGHVCVMPIEHRYNICTGQRDVT